MTHFRNFNQVKCDSSFLCEELIVEGYSMQEEKSVFWYLTVGETLEGFIDNQHAVIDMFKL